ncbi:MAG: hypothetical protein NTV52_11120 [Acidobacteria bacterium]|nr:hypothetical protein [Acidobacteriota bacterium]
MNRVEWAIIAQNIILRAGFGVGIAGKAIVDGLLSVEQEPAG